MWLNTLQHHPWPTLQWGVVIAGALTGAVLDARSHRIPNLLTGPLLAGGFVVSTLAGGFFGLLDAAAACAVMALPFVLLFAMAGGGAGDAKLMGALGAWLGVVQGAVVLAAVLVCGGIAALLFAMARGRLRRTVGLVGNVSRTFAAVIAGSVAWRDAGAALPAQTETQPMPYGPAICLGVLVSRGGMWLWQA